MGDRLIHRFAFALLGLVTSSVSTYAADGADEPRRYPLDGNYPVRTEDAFVTSYKKLALKFVSQYTHDQDSTDITSIAPELEWGFAPSFDLHVSSSYLVGGGDRGGSGDIAFNSQWQFHTEHEHEALPSLAIEAQATAPSGVGSDGVDTTLVLIATKTLSWAPSLDALHVNLSWTHDAARDGDSRANTYFASLAYTRWLTDKLALATDVYWETTGTPHSAGQSVELGLIYEINDDLSVAGSVGTGLGDDSPHFAALFGFLWEL